MEPDNEENALPFVAPCKKLKSDAPFRWLQKGWKDLRQARAQSLTYGAIIVLLSYLISFVTWKLGNLGLYLGLLSGFVFLGPLLALTLYSISAQLQRNRQPRLGESLKEAKRHIGNAMVYTVMMTIVFLVWARAASMVHIFFPTEGKVELADLALFLTVGSGVGAIFCVIIFTFSAFSLPMILDRKADMVTAVVTSTNAVLRNKPTMLLWALIIVVCVFIGFATAFLGLAVLIPLLGHATWHAYQETIDASAWPQHESPTETSS